MYRSWLLTPSNLGGFCLFGGFFEGEVATPCSMWDISSLIRDQTYTPYVEAQSLNLWTAREVHAWGVYAQAHLVTRCLNS